MISWKEEVIIEANIETVWELFQDENIKTIMPKVEEHVLIEKQEGEVGAKYRQTYKEGKRVETYTVEILDYKDEVGYKRKETHFVLAKAFEVDYTFTLHKLSETETKFIYEGSNKGVNFVGRAMMKLGNLGKKDAGNRVVHEFLERVEQEALKKEQQKL